MQVGEARRRAAARTRPPFGPWPPRCTAAGARAAAPPTAAGARPTDAAAGGDERRVRAMVDETIKKVLDHQMGLVHPRRSGPMGSRMCLGGRRLEASTQKDVMAFALSDAMKEVDLAQPMLRS